jgi:hypothetical protein
MFGLEDGSEFETLPNASEFLGSALNIAIGKLKNYKSPGSDQILAELIRTGGETLWSGIHELVNSIWNKEEWTDQWKGTDIVPISKKGYKTDCSNYRKVLLLSTSYSFFSSTLLSKIRDSAVSIVTGYWLDDRGVGSSSPGRVKNFHFSMPVC